jgi:hypothetical protein
MTDKPRVYAPGDSVPTELTQSPQFLASERDVELHSTELRKELTLSNLVFTQVLSIVGLAWIGTAGKLGASHLLFWIGAIGLFYIPSAAVVIHLNNEMPLEGGLYQWAKHKIVVPGSGVVTNSPPTYS